MSDWIENVFKITNVRSQTKPNVRPTMITLSIEHSYLCACLSLRTLVKVLEGGKN